MVNDSKSSYDSAGDRTEDLKPLWTEPKTANGKCYNSLKVKSWYRTEREIDRPGKTTIK